MPIRKNYKRVLYAVLILIVVWVLLAQFLLLKNRLSDEEARSLFARKGVELTINDTLIEGRNIHYAVTGSDTLSTLVFIHGSPGSWSNYRKYMWDDSLRKKFRMISLDRPGFGYSDFGKPMHLETQSEILGRLLATFKNGKSFIMFGHSMGAPVAVQVTLMQPELVTRLILAGAPLDVKFEKPERWRHLMSNKPLYYALPGAYGPSNTELLYLKKDLVNLQTQYGKVNCDVQFIHGTDDSWVPIGSIRLAIETMANARSMRIDTVRNAGHMIPWKNQEVLLQLLRETPE